MNRNINLILAIMSCGILHAQQDVSSLVELDSISDVVEVSKAPNKLINAQLLHPVFAKLKTMDRGQHEKVRFVHVGDSHIQADYLTGRVRETLQTRFGNGGLGFVFPHKLAKTNGSYSINYSANTTFTTYKNTKPYDASQPVGLSGFALKSAGSNFGIEVLVKEQINQFSTVKIFAPNKGAAFDFAFDSRVIETTQEVKSASVHKVKKGEAISTIANKYGMTVAALKSANGLKSNNIQAGKTLKIPNRGTTTKTVKRSEYIPLGLNADANGLVTYHADKLLSKIYLVPQNNANQAVLNGLMLENDADGITYSGIGVNGSRYADFNKYDLFFEQAQYLNADVMVVSFGTNESFDKMDAQAFLGQLKTFQEKIKAVSPNTVLLITTPTPSLLYRKYQNTYLTDFADAIIKYAQTEQNIVVWDCLNVLGGIKSVPQLLKSGALAKDKVHYTKLGYENQADLLSQAFLDAYFEFNLTK